MPTPEERNEVEKGPTSEVERDIEKIKAELRRASEPQAGTPILSMEAGSTKATRRYVVDQKTIDDIDNRFTYHSPKEDQLPRYGTLRFEALSLAHHIVVLTPPSREQSLALTHLETAIFFANAAIARHE